MGYLCQVRAGKVLLCRYQVNGVHRITGKEVCPCFPLQATAENFVNRMCREGATITPIDTSDREWMEGMEVENYAKAEEIYNMGQEAWEAYLAEEKAKTPEALRAALVFIGDMVGVKV